MDSRFAKPRNAFTVLELLIVITVVGMLFALALPAVQQVREAARNQACLHNLRQLGIALHGYHDVFTSLPAGWRMLDDQRTAYGWGTSVLPHLEQQALFRSVQKSTGLGMGNEAAAVPPPLPAFLCPSDFGQPYFDLFVEIGLHHSRPQQVGQHVLARLPRANFVAVFGNSDPDDVPSDRGEGPFVGDRQFRFRDLRRGLSQVALLSERTTRKLPSTWLGFDAFGEDAEGRVTGNLLAGPNRSDSDECELDSRHPGHVNFLWADGHASSIADTIDVRLYRSFGRRE